MMFKKLFFIAFVFVLISAFSSAVANEISFDGEKYSLRHSDFSKTGEEYEDIYLRKDDTLNDWTKKIRITYYLSAPSALGVIQKQESFLLVTAMPYYRLTSNLSYAQDTGVLSYYCLKSFIGEEKILEYTIIKAIPHKDASGKNSGAIGFEYTQVMSLKNLETDKEYAQALLKPDKRFFDLVLPFVIPDTSHNSDLAVEPAG